VRARARARESLRIAERNAKRVGRESGSRPVWANEAGRISIDAFTYVTVIRGLLITSRYRAGKIYRDELAHGRQKGSAPGFERLARTLVFH